MTIGEKIKALRKKNGLTQKKLGELSNLNEVTIRQYEAGKYKPKMENLQKLANALKVSISELVEGNIHDFLMDESYFAMQFPILNHLFKATDYDVQVHEFYNINTKDTEHIFIVCCEGETLELIYEDMEYLQKDVLAYFKFKVLEKSK